ncbi:MAG: type 4a pilus biogenesis protein PilO [Betaproteobacteria bacterium]|nr:type 4a pilus biogenesis protein PilO [Betaproteobacteria bacterium]MBK8739301.1 type 4a pilus biogenesis protein PilO [Betaproteobacteria bacterium]MBK9605836.1 type 4a pilus biogenesis protein PilO [Betaproteobacteria bacterium]
MNWFENFRRLNPREIGIWPWGAKLFVLFMLFLILMIFAALLDWRDQWDQLEAGQKEEESLRQSWVVKKQQAVNLDAYRQQLKDIEQQFGALLKQLPNRSEVDALLTDINQAGLGRGLEFELFRPGAQRVADFYSELPIQIKVTGSYHDMGAFASDVAQLSRIVTLNNITIQTEKNGLSMEAIAKTFRYLDDEEIAAQRKAVKGAPK